MLYNVCTSALGGGYGGTPYRRKALRTLRVGIAQINTTVGDLEGNAAKIIQTIDEARSLGVDLVAFPEMAVTGYPPEDLLFKPHFVERNCRCLQQIVRSTAGIAAVVGFVDSNDDIFNAAAIIHDGELVDVYHKMFLPNYGVFDENRYFQAGRDACVHVIRGVGVGVNICEDIWYEAGPATAQAYAGAEVLLNISSSPYHAEKGVLREKMLATRAVDNVAIVVYANLVGGQDELVFDGDSLILNERGVPVARGKQFEEELLVADLDVESVFGSRLRDPRRRKETLAAQSCGLCPRRVVSDQPVTDPKPPLPQRDVVPLGFPAEVYRALVVGTRDYVRKNGFAKVLIGLSGGVDSSLVAAIAVDALGPENVVGVSMPSAFTSEASNTDAQRLAANLGIEQQVVSIQETFGSYLETLSGPFAGTEPGVAEENLQARIRGNILMALSNKFGWLVLTTGNKSEMATGYATLYGDMAGGFAVIKDVPKTLVYQLCGYRNQLAGTDLIPENVLLKAPSAELRPDQRDTDSLPPYELLDPVLKAYVEEDKSVEQIVAMGFEEVVVRQVARMVDRNEYKRRQSPPGIKITPRAFGRDRRLPITNRYRG